MHNKKHQQEEILEFASHSPTEEITEPPDQLHNHEHNTEQYQQEMLEAIKELSNYDFLLLEEYVTDYFQTTTSRPPQEADKHFINSEMDRLSHQINQLWTKQEQLEKQIKSMQYNPLKVFSNKYSDALLRAQQTLENISVAIAQNKQLQQQLQEWEQHAIAHQSWLTDPHTDEMRNIAQVFNLPKIQQRLTAAKQEQQLQPQQWRSEYQSSFEQSHNYQHRRGFGR